MGAYRLRVRRLRNPGDASRPACRGCAGLDLLRARGRGRAGARAEGSSRTWRRRRYCHPRLPAGDSAKDRGGRRERGVGCGAPTAPHPHACGDLRSANRSRRDDATRLAARDRARTSDPSILCEAHRRSPAGDAAPLPRTRRRLACASGTPGRDTAVLDARGLATEARLSFRCTVAGHSAEPGDAGDGQQAIAPIWRTGQSARAARTELRLRRRSRSSPKRPPLGPHRPGPHQSSLAGSPVFRAPLSIGPPPASSAACARMRKPPSSITCSTASRAS